VRKNAQGCTPGSYQKKQKTQLKQPATRKEGKRKDPHKHKTDTHKKPNQKRKKKKLEDEQ